MKKLLLLLISPIISLSILMAAVCSAHAEEEKAARKRQGGISIGYFQHFSWFEPIWGNRERSRFLNQLYSAPGTVADVKLETMKIGRQFGFFYNPTIAVRMTRRWSISTAFSYGKMAFKGETKGFAADTMGLFFLCRSKTKLDVTRYEGELLVNFNITEWVKVFLGPKYQGYEASEEYRHYNYDTGGFFGFFPPLKDTTIYHAAGFGLGSQFEVKIYAGLYTFSNISFIMLAGNDTTGDNYWTRSQKSILIGTSAYSAFGYFIKPAGLTISTGFKCQFYYYTKTPRPDQGKKHDMLYGPFVSVFYTY